MRHDVYSSLQLAGAKNVLLAGSKSLRGLGALAVAGYHFAGCAVNGVPLLPDGR